MIKGYNDNYSYKGKFGRKYMMFSSDKEHEEYVELHAEKDDDDIQWLIRERERSLHGKEIMAG